MKKIKTKFKDLFVVNTSVFKDNRGWVKEEFKKPQPFISNPVLTLENEHLCIFNQTFELDGKPTMSINTTHLKDGKA